MNGPARILHLISRLDAYGAARMLRHLAERQAAEGAEVVVAALAADAPAVGSLRDAGVEVHALGSRGSWDFVAPARLVRIATRVGADLVHAWDARTLAWATLAPRRPDAPPVVATLNRRDAARAWTARVVRRAARFACFVPADHIAQAWLAQCGVGDVCGNTVLPGAAPIVAPESDADLRQKFRLPADAPLLAIVSPLVRSKRLDDAIWHFELVRVLHPHARLLIVGDGPDRARLERFASQVSDLEAVRFVGYVDHPARVLAHVDVYWHLSPSPATPWALMEALAAGAAVVVADVPAHRTIVADSVNGRLVLGDDRAAVTRATDELLSNQPLAQKLGQAATHILADRPLGQALDLYRQAYRQACEPVAAVGIGI